MEQSTSTELVLYSPVGSGGQLSGLDARLLQIVAEAGGRISAEEISRKLGVESMTAARCGQRVREILKSQDLLSQTEQKALILLDFIKLRDTLFERIDGTETKFDRHGNAIDVESSPAWANALIRLLREWRALIESMDGDVQSEKVLIREAHAAIMMEAMQVMFDRFMLRLEQAGYDIPRPMAMEIMEEVMPLGFQALEKKTQPA